MVKFPQYHFILTLLTGRGRTPRSRRVTRWVPWLCAVVSFCLAAAPLSLVLPPPSLERGRSASVLVLAADGSILRGFLSADGKWRLPIASDQVDLLYRRMVIAAEDSRFDWHPG